ncbi:Similar to Pnlip: Pancreatic triacylglycerol lipase (Mus musculus) [Cotesia congregata]|uniref:phospholipase A1 n=1 Tax=Cotesia congregata TaxID=51543 RepID=A0A8J2EIK1_COTCN|nr:Similar to Pnlip: Pancreatic triacylglycerol lipase (Mus musculus) [Cotesia congregata]
MSLTIPRKFFFIAIGFIILNYVKCLSLQFSDIKDLINEKNLIDTLDPLLLKNANGLILNDALEATLILDQDVQFHLFTKENPDFEYPLKIHDNSNLNDSPFNNNVSTKIIIHGWTDSVHSNWIKELRNNYLLTDNYNIICVNWYPVSAKEYRIAEKLTRQIGEYIGDFIDYLKINSNISLDTVHILGHSLGAHIAGFAGSKLFGEIGRITGMDPARPLFEAPILKDTSDRLDFSDANFVDIIHTCAGTVGFVKPIGHADFYPNGGTYRQPGCPVFITQYCSHGKSHQYMAESIIHPEEFVAVKCDSWKDYKANKCYDNTTAIMGEYISTDTHGIFFLETKPDFSLIKYFMI